VGGCEILLPGSRRWETAVWSSRFINYIYPVYVRGQAYLSAHNAAAATSEFQKLVDHKPGSPMPTNEQYLSHHISRFALLLGPGENSSSAL
jgi:hypothetical protein